MTDQKKTKNLSPLVQAVVALDEVFLNLTQLGSKIDGLNLKSNSDLEQADGLMARFTEVGEAVSLKIGAVALALNEARTDAETATRLVSEKAIQLLARKTEIEEKLREFRLLGEKVAKVTSSLSDADHENMSTRFAEVEAQIRPLIEEAQQLKETAQLMKIKILEQGADSMRQSLLAVSQKMSAVVR